MDYPFQWEHGYLAISMGYGSLYKNSAGDYNTAVGYYSLYSNTGGTRNIAIGSSELDITEKIIDELNTKLPSIKLN